VNKDEIICNLSQEQWFKAACKNIGGHLSDDLQQEFLLLLLTKDEEYIIKITPYLKWWTISTLINIASPGNGRKAFHKLHGNKHEPISDNHQSEGSENFNEELTQARDNVINTLQWFDRKLFELFESGIPPTRIHLQTNINYKTIKASITQTRTLIKIEYERLLANNIAVMYGEYCR
jgi:hypothetical protein